MAELNKEETNRTINSWLTKGGAGIVASGLFWFGTSFVEKQEEIIASLNELQRQVVINEAARDRLQYQIDDNSLEIKELAKLIGQQWARSRRNDEIARIIVREIESLHGKALDIPELEKF